MVLRLGCKVMDGLMHMIWIMMHMRQSVGKTTGAPGQKGTWQLSILLWYVAVQWGKRKDRIVWSMKVGLEMAVDFLELCPNAIWPCIMIPGAIPRCLHSFTSKGYARAFSGGLSEGCQLQNAQSLPGAYRTSGGLTTESSVIQKAQPLHPQGNRLGGMIQAPEFSCGVKLGPGLCLKVNHRLRFPLLPWRPTPLLSPRTSLESHGHPNSCFRVWF